MPDHRADPTKTQKLRGLVVDDSPAARAQARNALEDAAAELNLTVHIEEAVNGVDALRLLAQATVDILVVDLHMPDITGLEVLAFWRKRSATPGLCAVVVSTDVSARDREKAVESGALGILEKPVTGAALIGVLAHALGSRGEPTL